MRRHPPAARYAREVGPAALGRRVSVRLRLPDGRLRDVVGRLEEWADERLVVRRRDGTTASAPVGDVVGSRVLPDEAGPRTGGG